MSNNKQSSVEWLIIQLTEVDYNCINKTFLQSNNSLAGYKMRELFEQAKAMQQEQAQLYATFVLKCVQNNLPTITFNDWINLDNNEQQ